MTSGRQAQDKLEKDLGKITHQTSKIRHDLIRDNQTTARELTYRMNESDQRLKKSERKLNDITKNTDVPQTDNDALGSGTQFSTFRRASAVNQDKAQSKIQYTDAYD